MSIEVHGLIKQYGQQKAVDDISFEINKGEIVGFLGPNGAGKSTTMKIITGYLLQDAGTVSICGIDVKNNSVETKKKIGYLPESNPLYVDMFVKEYLQFIAGVHQIGNRESEIARVIELTGLQLEQKKKISQLSKGYKQRVGLAAALIHDPEVLILDEPTSGLDPNQIIEIRNVIKQQGKNKTVLFSSHILQEVQAVCDRVIIINKGKIVADDSLSNINQYKKEKNILTVEFETINEEQLQKIKLIAAEKLTFVNNKVSIQTNNPEALRKHLLQLSLQQNLNIVSLQMQSQSLEDVFRSLTIKQ
ncbi:MAG TPA: gliding motility-associated ABC transporter ATP-binding subunit GldA [Chitinophagaceae bacterium]|nr:gliding motility-associated ABC transporter ATP-binding subunit GldA [Chitinophagaceae bacterium]